MPIPGRFPTGMKIFQIPLSWFRRVTAWLNNFCGGTGINVTHPSDPSDVSPVMVSIDREWLKDEIKANATSLTAGDGIDITNNEVSVKAKTNGGITVDSNDGVSIDSDHLGEGTSVNTATDTVSLTAATESGSGYPSLDPTTWKADTTQASLTLFCITRFYDPGGNLSARYLLGRTLTFSPNGRLLEMSAENRVYKVRTT